MDSLVERLKPSIIDLGARITTLQSDNARLLARVEELERGNARLREALENIESGNYPRPVGKAWERERPSKHDRCIHDVWMYETCEGCLDAFVAQALKEQADADQ